MVEDELSPGMRYAIREAAKQIYLDPEAYIFSFYALSKQMKDHDSVMKALEICLSFR